MKPGTIIIGGGVFERFTEEARQVVVLAQEEARALSHSYIGTEHILLGLLREEEGRDEEAQALGPLGVTLAQTREVVVRIVGRGEEGTGGQIPFTPRAKKVLELALREALTLGHAWIGPEHVLLGVVRENEGVASRVLLEFDADAEKVRNRVIRILTDRPRLPKTPPPRAIHRPGTHVESGWLDGLESVLARLAIEIRQALERDPDVGDLLLVIASAPDTVSAAALNELGIDLDTLWGTLERTRQRRRDDHAELSRRLNDVRARKEQAIENQEFDKAAQLRDEQRELSAQLGRTSSSERELLRELRRRLGNHGPAE